MTTINVPGGKSLIAVLKTEQTRAMLEKHCENSRDIVADIKVIDDPVSNALDFVNGGADIVVLEAGLIDEDSFSKVTQLCAYVARGGSVIVIADEPAMSIVRRLFQAGVTDVLPTPVVENELVAALNTAAASKLRRAEQPAETPPVKGVILTVLKSAGGVGATTTAVNLATEIRQQYSASVTLADFDLQFGNLHLALDIQPRMSLIEAISAGDRLDAMLLRSTLMNHKSGVDLLACPPEITSLEAVNSRFINDIFSHFRAISDFTIIELPANWCDWTGAVLAESDLIISVLEPTVRSGAGAARIKHCFADLGLANPPLHIVANKVAKSFAMKDRVDRLTEIMGGKPDSIIHDDAAAASEALDCGVPIRNISAKSPTVKDFARMAQKVVSRVRGDLVKENAPSQNKGFSFRALRPGGGGS